MMKGTVIFITLSILSHTAILLRTHISLKDTMLPKTLQRITNFILCTLLMTALAGCSGDQLSKSLTLEGYGTLSYPSGWQVLQEPPRAVVGPGSSTLYKADMFVGFGAYYAGSTDPARAWEHMLGDRRRDEKFKIGVQPRPFSLDGSEGLRVEYESSGPNAARLFYNLDVIAPHPVSGELVLISFSAASEEWPTFSPTAETILDAFMWSQ